MKTKLLALALVLGALTASQDASAAVVTRLSDGSIATTTEPNLAPYYVYQPGTQLIWDGRRNWW